MTPEPYTQNTAQQNAQSIHQLAATVSQIAEQLQQVSLQLNQLGGQVVPKPQTASAERFSSLEDLVRQLGIRVSGLERQLEQATSRPAVDEFVKLVELETAEVETEIDDEIEDEPDEILWDFIDPVALGSQARPS